MNFSHFSGIEGFSYFSIVLYNNTFSGGGVGVGDGGVGDGGVGGRVKDYLD